MYAGGKVGGDGGWGVSGSQMLKQSPKGNGTWRGTACTSTMKKEESSNGGGKEKKRHFRNRRNKEACSHHSEFEWDGGGEGGWGGDGISYSNSGRRKG